MRSDGLQTLIQTKSCIGPPQFLSFFFNDVEPNFLLLFFFNDVEAAYPQFPSHQRGTKLSLFPKEATLLGIIRKVDKRRQVWWVLRILRWNAYSSVDNRKDRIASCANGFYFSGKWTSNPTMRVQFKLVTQSIEINLTSAPTRVQKLHWTRSNSSESSKLQGVSPPKWVHLIGIVERFTKKKKLG